MSRSAKDLVGTYELVSAVTTLQDGSKVEPFGPKPKGLYVFDGGGRFIYAFTRAELPKFASGNRIEGTPEEDGAVVRGSIAGFGTYAVEAEAIALKFEASTFPNWTGTVIRQTIVSLTRNEVKWRIAASAGGAAEVTLKRVA